MCIRDRYQRRVHGESRSMPKKKKEEISSEEDDIEETKKPAAGKKLMLARKTEVPAQKGKVLKVGEKRRVLDIPPDDDQVEKKRAVRKKTKKNDDGDEDEAVQFLTGQRYPTPPDGDGTRAFYESLLEQNPNSKMAEKWALEYGLFEEAKATEVFERLQREKKKK
eukprot:TRINITY_DN8067_c0_g1_i2.p1 TRINITY_DN8067_c0_g1~~TRINITY_DN8067_c0_g1_i2.p1  ORF type:complete len:165 (+),score=65.98 TRINITY_DN8067_c0_g1_i2:66-560(+)